MVSDLTLERLHFLTEVSSSRRHILPASVAHATLKDDWYNGFFIPKGSTVVPVWKAMREDDKLYDNPLDFKPERWIGKPGQPNNWGYGRRICAGRHIAKNTVTVAIARILWGFNLRTRDGKRLLVDDSMFTEGFVSAPRSFDIVFEPRSDMHRFLIKSEFETVEKDPDRLLAGVRKMQVEAGLKPRA